MAMKDVFIKMDDHLLTQPGKDAINRLQGLKSQFNPNGTSNVRNEFISNRKSGGGNIKQNIAGGSTINSALVVNNKI